MRPSWDRGFSASSTEELPDPPSDCDLPFGYTDLPAPPPEDLLLQLGLAQPHLWNTPEDDLPLPVPDSDPAPTLPEPDTLLPCPLPGMSEPDLPPPPQEQEHLLEPAHLLQMEAPVDIAVEEANPEPCPPETKDSVHDLPGQETLLPMDLLDEHEIGSEDNRSAESLHLPEAGELLQKLVNSLSELTRLPPELDTPDEPLEFTQEDHTESEKEATEAWLLQEETKEPEQEATKMPEQEVNEVPESTPLPWLLQEATNTTDQGPPKMLEQKATKRPEQEATKIPEQEANHWPEQEIVAVPESTPEPSLLQEATNATEQEPPKMPEQEANKMPEQEVVEVPELTPDAWLLQKARNESVQEVPKMPEQEATKSSEQEVVGVPESTHETWSLQEATKEPEQEATELPEASTKMCPLLPPALAPHPEQLPSSPGVQEPPSSPRPRPSPLRDASLPPAEGKLVLAPCPSPLPKPPAIVKPCPPPAPSSPPASPGQHKPLEYKTAGTAEPAAITVMTTLVAADSTPAVGQEEKAAPAKPDEAAHDHLQTKPCEVSDFKVSDSEQVQSVESGDASDKSGAGTEPAAGEVMGPVDGGKEPDAAKEEVDEPLPPVKSYNLDFLDKLDDPNFNPFETKTAVLNNFDSSAPADATTLKVEAPETTEPAAKPGEKAKKPPVRKTMVRKPLLKKTVKKPEPVVDEPAPPAGDGEDERPPAPAKAYNLDFLDNLDDPNFNPFETKIAVKDNFTTSAPVEIDDQDIVKEKEPTSPIQTEEPKKKPQPKKPWLRKQPIKKNLHPPPPEAEAEAPKDEDDLPVPAPKGYNMDFLANLDDPNFNPFETKTAVVEKFDSTATTTEPTFQMEETTMHTMDPEEVISEETLAEQNVEQSLPVKPWLKKGGLKNDLPKEEESVEEEQVPVPSKPYNLDFLDKLDDPNFNPFETKSSVVNNSEASPVQAASEGETEVEEEKEDRLAAGGLEEYNTSEFEATEAQLARGFLPRTATHILPPPPAEDSSDLSFW
jgi:hypothetical protein